MFSSQKPGHSCPHSDPLYYHPSRDPDLTRPTPTRAKPTPINATPPLQNINAAGFFKVPEKRAPKHPYNLRPKK